MINALNEKIVEETFNQSYDKEQFAKFIRDLLVDANFEKAHNIQLPDVYKDFIKSARRICKYKYTSEDYIDEKVVDVLVVTLKRCSSVERARTAQRNFIARYLNGSRNYQKDAALVAFISEDENGKFSPDWRFSLVQMNYKTEIVENPDGKKKRVTSVELTPAKRFSFLVGENENTHTAQRQFYNCLEKSSKGEKITIEDLVQAFDIEKVSKEFFEEYKKLYQKLVDELERLYDSDDKVHKDFDKHNINIKDFAKKTLGQLVFLYFIQKKGWLGVKADKDWGTGDKKFLRNVFDKKYGDYDNFFNDVLEHLFYEALASDRGKGAWFDTLNCRVPFLNGGLFDPVNGYEYQITDLTIDNNIFKEIFDTFDLYNFTVKEDEPLEKEVAIDPEMLGKVFENLLPENIRKGNGAFYTPREIVHYMCQESLINYLYNKLNIKECSSEVTEEIVPKNDIEFLIKTGASTYKNISRKINVELPETIKDNAQLIDNALADIKVCDPAIGSGAFPVGMMNEIVRARAALNDFIGQSDRSMYQLKRNAIENSIYGVDIDAGAVDIAKLRFWLSLVVDEEDIKNIKPLPNLDYKIMQGNSLITSYEGIDFDEIMDVYKSNPQMSLNLWQDQTQNLKQKLRNKQTEFLKTAHASDKLGIKHDIENIIVDIVKEQLQIKAKEGKINYQELEEKVRNFAQNKEKRTFFPWKMFFSDVFDNGGFDVVIGNPPYVKEYTDKTAFDGLRESKYYQGKMDLWYFFGCKGLDILKNNGFETFIAPNNWMTNAGASIFRNKVLNETKILSFMDFGNYKVFDTASIQTMVYILQKSNRNDKYLLNYSKLINDSITKNELEVFLSNDNNEKSNDFIKYELIFNNSDYKDNFITFLEPKFNNLLSKIKTNGQYYLQENDVAQGIVAPQDSLNKKSSEKLGEGHVVGEGIFVLTEIEKSKLNLTEDEENDIIRPLYTTNEINKYYANRCNKYWLIYTTSKFKDPKNIEKYPNIKKHLDCYSDVITSDNKPYGLHRAREEKFFIGEKIISLRKCQRPTFSYVDFDSYVLQTFFIIKPQNINLKYLTGILNSKLIEFWLRYQGKMQGNNYQIDKEPLMKIPLYDANENETEKVTSVVDKILDITKDDDYLENKEKQQAVKEYEKQIDIVVYKLYDLTYDEVKTIDKDFSMSEEEYNKYKL